MNRKLKSISSLDPVHLRFLQIELSSFDHELIKFFMDCYDFAFGRIIHPDDSVGMYFRFDRITDDMSAVILREIYSTHADRVVCVSSNYHVGPDGKPMLFDALTRFPYVEKEQKKVQA